MSTVHYRPAQAADLPAAIELFLAAVADMFARHQIKQPLPPRAALDLMWPHILKTGLFYVAEADGRLVAICHAIVRDRLWFLSGFWTRTDLVSKGVGGPLLRRVMHEGARAGADTFFVWSSPDETAISTYLKAGMLPGYQLFTFAGAPTGLPAAPEGYEVEPLTLDVACALDAEIRATRREVDHRFWLAQPHLVARQVIRNGRPAGYFYTQGDAVGPLGWSAPEDAAALLACACQTAARATGTISLRVPGINHTALRFALAHGLRLTASSSHLFTSAPFGRLEQYIPSGPSLY